MANNQSSYLFGLDESGRKIVDTINVGSKGCIAPNSVKIDRNQNIWIDCSNAYTPPGYQGTTGSEQEYSRAGVLRRTYTFTASCPKSGELCEANSLDGGPDDNGHVFVNLSFGAYLLGGLRLGFYWWSVGNPTAQPRFVDVGAFCQPICRVLYTDVDNSGNLWFTYSNPLGYGLAELAQPTTNPKLSIVYGPGEYRQASGVFRSDGGKTLNVVDAGTQRIYQYTLPVTSSAKPFNTLGPTPTGLSDGYYAYGFPMTGGFNRTGTKLAIGDAGGWLDMGTAAQNKWRAVLNLKFLFHDSAASYTPSDR